MIPNTRIVPLMHYGCEYDAEHFVAQCKRELQQHPLTPIESATARDVAADANADDSHKQAA